MTFDNALNIAKADKSIGLRRDGWKKGEYFPTKNIHISPNDKTNSGRIVPPTDYDLEDWSVVY
ncbi:hypothetical protein AGMMS49991_05600 [Spirochaetia bacterium]|nr:hypothetical protein AGMMS49991_05600 [Spirochaetia bacterium]